MPEQQWDFRNLTSQFIVRLPIDIPDGTEHITIHISKTRQTLAINFLGNAEQGALRSIRMQYRVLAASYMMASKTVIVQCNMPEGGGLQSLIAEIIEDPEQIIQMETVSLARSGR